MSTIKILDNQKYLHGPSQQINYMLTPGLQLNSVLYFGYARNSSPLVFYVNSWYILLCRTNEFAVGFELLMYIGNECEVNLDLEIDLNCLGIYSIYFLYLFCYFHWWIFRFLDRVDYDHLGVLLVWVLHGWKESFRIRVEVEIIDFLNCDYWLPYWQVLFGL